MHNEVGTCAEMIPKMFQQSSTREVLEKSYETVSKMWKTNFVKHATENYFHLHTAKGQPKKLEEPELDLVQLLIKSKPSVTYMAKLDTCEVVQCKHVMLCCFKFHPRKAKLYGL